MKSVSFAGSGFLCLYLTGAARCLQQRVPDLLTKVALCGASSGSLVAACLACQLPLEALEETVLSAAREARGAALGTLSPSFRIEEHLRRGLDRLPPDAHQRARGRLFVSLTRARNGRNEMASEWASRQELIECLLASCFIPLFSGLRLPPKYRGARYVDGGFSDNLPVSGRPTLTVSPFAGNAHISPTDGYKGTFRVRVGNHAMDPTSANLIRFIRALLPPPLERLEELRDKGFEHASAALKNGGAKKECVSRMRR